MTRRVIAAGAVLVVLILIVLGVRSCQISARNSSLKDYANNVSSLNQQSVQTGQQFFNQLSSGNKSGNGTALQNQLNETRLQADNELAKARGLDTPDEMKAAQSNFVLAMEMRRNGIAGVAVRDPAGARDDDEQGCGQRDRRRDGAVLRLRRRLQGLHGTAHLRRARGAPASPSAAPTGSRSIRTSSCRTSSG